MGKQTAGLMLMPRYVNRFACIGGDCEDTCCCAWQIDLDKACVLLYQASLDPELRPLFAKYVKRNPPPQTVRLYGQIEMLEAPCLECPFLDESRLCRIQTRLGEKALSDTCAHYPRNTVHLGDFHQMTLQLSCPEAARLALLEADAFDMEAHDARVRSGSVGRLDPKNGLTREDMDEIRTEMFQILLTRELDLSRRLAVLGLFCQRLTELIEQGKIANLPGLIRTMDAHMENGASQVPLKSLAERQSARVKFAWIFLLAMLISKLPPHQRRVIDAVASGLGIRADGQLDEAALMQGFKVGTERLDVALQAAPWVLEHYLDNEALREVFPWSKENPLQHFIHFLMRFTILRVMLAGRAAAQEDPLSPQALAETVQVFCRRVQNGKKFIDQINPEVTEGDWTSLSTLFTLV